jgi:hypothetical protein
VVAGRNVLIAPNVGERHFLTREIPSGDSVNVNAPALAY